MVEVDQTWLGILMAACCVPSVVGWTLWRLREPRAGVIASVVDGVMMGLGTGLSVAAVIFGVEVLIFLVIY